MTTYRTRCCIAGGGPAGMMLGLLLARAGIDVIVLEKHADFLRDFRGDTIHPSTLQVMHELGLLDALLTRPHTKVPTLGADIGNTFVEVADFTHLPTRCGFIALMPQWDFLDFLASHAKTYPGFHLLMRTEATGLIEENGRVCGVRATGPDGDVSVEADLVVAADGRHSALRDAGGFEVLEMGAPIDVLWMRLSRRPDDPEVSLGRVIAGGFLITINRGEYWQCAFVIPKGGIEPMRARDLSEFRSRIVSIVPAFTDRVQELRDWNDIKLLTVAVNRVRKWHRSGMLLIGDAAHAMSPVGGVGINLAIQDAVAAASLLAPHLRNGVVSDGALQAVQRRRELPTRLTQRLQIVIQNRVISRVLHLQHTPRVPFALRLMQLIPALRRLPARLIGMGLRPEHVRSI